MSHVFGDKMGSFNLDLIYINLDDVNFDEDDPETVIQVRFKA